MTVQPDLEMAEDFLAALVMAPGRPFTFQTFADGVSAKKASPPPRIVHGPLAEHASTLTRLSGLGHGVFFMMNQGDGHGRKKSNVRNVIAAALDLDGAPIEPVLAIEMPPHIVVETSPGRWHAYWRLKDGTLGEFASRQKALAKRFGGDPSICDVCRVMRLPGFIHQKNPGTPFLSRIVSIDGKAYR